MTSNRLNFSEDYTIVDSICLERNIQTKTRETYLQTIDHYTELFNQSFTSLTQTYYQEEENIVWKKRTLKQHLILYRNYLYNTFLPNTAKIYFGKLLTILRHMELELGQLPKLNNKNNNELPPITYEDLPTKSDIENAYNIANPVMKAVILFILRREYWGGGYNVFLFEVVCSAIQISFRCFSCFFLSYVNIVLCSYVFIVGIACEVMSFIYLFTIYGILTGT